MLATIARQQKGSPLETTPAPPAAGTVDLRLLPDRPLLALIGAVRLMEDRLYAQQLLRVSAVLLGRRQQRVLRRAAYGLLPATLGTWRVRPVAEEDCLEVAVAVAPSPWAEAGDDPGVGG